MPSNQAAYRVASGGLAPWQVRRATRLLLSEDRSDQGVEALAAACGLSRSHFGRAFKASTGVSPHQWLLRHHVQRAGEMLARTNDSISAIAVNCGFADQSHLSRAFHAVTGTSPADWRRQRRPDEPMDAQMPDPNFRLEEVSSWLAKKEHRRTLVALFLTCLCAFAKDVP
jgi:transcriptional regulator GlxA family with amidase domain